jgi:hypothetical protein
VKALTAPLAGPCPRSAHSQPHTWKPGASDALASFGALDHRMCRYCAVPLLAVLPAPEGLRGGRPFLEVPRAQL